MPPAIPVGAACSQTSGPSHPTGLSPLTRAFDTAGVFTTKEMINPVCPSHVISLVGRPAQVIAIGDGANDLAMIDAAGLVSPFSLKTPLPIPFSSPRFKRGVLAEWL